MTRPLLGWLGSKRGLAPVIDEIAGPATGGFYDLFGGSAAVTLHRRAARPDERVVLVELDHDLVRLHREVAQQPDVVCAELGAYREGGWDEGRYLELRDERINGTRVRPASDLIAYNKTAFNGLWRKNRDNRFNVGWNKAARPAIPTDEHVHEVSALLRDVDIEHGNAFEVLGRLGSGDVAYLDPGYGAFTAYGTGRSFHFADFLRLVEAAEAAAARGARIVLSYSDDPEPDDGVLLPAGGGVRRVLRRWDVRHLEVRESVSCDGSGRSRPRREVLAAIGPRSDDP